MTKSSKILSVLVLLQSLVQVLLIGVIVKIRFEARNLLETSLPNYALVSDAKDTPVEKAELVTDVSLNLVWWDQDSGFESIKEKAEYITSVSPFWYELTTAGEIDTFSGAENQEIISFLKQNNIKVTPVISNEFNTEPLSSILSGVLERDKLHKEIISIASDYDGISLNFENLNAKDKDNYSNFVAKLAADLHKEEKTLTVHLHAKTEAPGTWNGPQAQDWQKLGESCDKLKVMAYDYHWSTSEAGAIAPPDWVEEVLEHAAELIPEKKVYLGIPLYGYDWVEEEGEGVTFEQVSLILQSENKTSKFDSSTKSPFFTYTQDGTKHEVWYENAESTKYKLELAKEYNIGGVDFWRIGGEDPTTWDQISKILENNN